MASATTVSKKPPSLLTPVSERFPAVEAHAATQSLPLVYKTVKPKPDDDKALRRDRYIWLVKLSFDKASPLMSRVENVKAEKGEDGSGEGRERRGEEAWNGPTVWPYLW